MNDWQIIDKDGYIHSGTAEEMAKAWMYMTLDKENVKEILGDDFDDEEYENDFSEYDFSYEGDLLLVEIKDRY